MPHPDRTPMINPMYMRVETDWEIPRYSAKTIGYASRNRYRIPYINFGYMLDLQAAKLEHELIHTAV